MTATPPDHERQGTRQGTRQWTTKDFDFELPEDLIAQRPSEQRGGSRLMCLKPDHEAEFMPFAKIIDAFQGNEVLVLNDTRVVPARLYGQKATGGRVEVFFLETLANGQILAMTRGKLKPGHQVNLAFDAQATLISRDEHGRGIFDLKLSTRFTENYTQDQALWAWLEEAGKLPLPPYIEREADALDSERYQTVFAREPGAVAAPTAGLHFTQKLLAALQDKGVSVAYVTLHVGPGTFLPVKTDSIEEHVMHSERYSVPLATQELLKSQRPVVAVGTTCVRAIESFMALCEQDPNTWGNEALHATDIFIKPGYQWRSVDGLLTNFHLPQSTLLMLVSAFAGYEQTHQAYQRAIEEKLKFYSYGDASLFWRPQGRWQTDNR